MEPAAASPFPQPVGAHPPPRTTLSSFAPGLRDKRLTVLALVACLAAVKPLLSDELSPRLERRVRAALDAEQREAFAAGAAASEIVLADGQTLAELLIAAAAEAEQPLAYVALDPCLLVRTAGSAAGALQPGQIRGFRARGSLRPQGGAIAGCGVPEAARALAVIARALPRGKGSRANCFTIRTSKPGVEVSWQVTGIRRDAFANAHRIPVEELKPAAERGRFLHPKALGQPEERGVERLVLEELAGRQGIDATATTASPERE